MSGRNLHKKNPWAVEAYESYLRCCVQRGVENPPQFAQNHLGFASNQWRNFHSCEVVLGDSSLYAGLFLWGVKEADPRTIPDRLFSPRQRDQQVTRRRAWTEEEWQAWLTTKEAKRIANLTNYPWPSNQSWEANLARDLADLSYSMGWSDDDLDDLRESLGISREHWDVIASGAAIIDAPNDGNPYALLFNGLGIGDPRTLPQADVTDSRGRLVRKRQWTEGRLIYWEQKMGLQEIPNERGWREWWEENEERIYMSVMPATGSESPAAVFAPHHAQPAVPFLPSLEEVDSEPLGEAQSQLAEEDAVVLPQDAPSKLPAAASFEAVLGMLGAFMDSTARQQADQNAALIAVVQQKLGDAVAEVKRSVTAEAEETRREVKKIFQEQLDGIVEQVRAAILQDLEPIWQQIKDLVDQKADKPDTLQLAAILQALSEKIDALGAPDQGDEKQSVRRQRRGDRVQEIAALTRQLTSLLQEYWGADVGARDQLVQTNGKLLGTLLTVLDPLTLPADKRERSIQLAGEVNT